MTAFLIVKAKVPNNLIKNFDEWYKKNHLTEAHMNFKSISSFRGWINKNEHHAFYQFKDLSTAKNILDSKELSLMIKKFDKKWLGNVSRSRELIEIIQKI
tara:strand:+ start:214 stop:513 length:300 start_codon:yes stop_codon:yes gene_type:complete